MSQAQVHLAYAPRGVGLLYAVMWFAVGDHVYGWCIGSKDGGHLAFYFMLQDYFAHGETHLYRSVEDDVYGAWVEARPAGDMVLPHPPPVPEAVCHELNRLQDQFVRHWLFFDDDPLVDDEAQAMRARELSVRHVNIRASRLDKLATAAAVWRFNSPDADAQVLDFLSRRWPLDFDAQG
ncbi:hypothetical protein [Piscinibacter sp.]|uniref:hypothetical protein n=1 Tax=Piscinibacter sp. TaxID=1903157 RepID=UPI002C64EFEC|nr:hypothetical protein [Albitalea sp.]HUG26353.1 hypothetical protein [Albitalea sp.]